MGSELTAEEHAERRALKPLAFKLCYTWHSLWTAEDRKAFIRFEDLTARAMESKRRAALLMLS